MARFEGHSRSAMGFVWLSTPRRDARARRRAAPKCVPAAPTCALQLKATELGLQMHPMSQALQEFAEMKPHYDALHALLVGRPATRRRCRCSAASATARRSSTRRGAASMRSCARERAGARNRPETIAPMALLARSRRRAAPRAADTGRAERPARDREATKARILGAVGDVLARDGFGGVGVNAIAKEAGVDKVLIYRYFGGLPELLRDLGRERPLLAAHRRAARRRPGRLPRGSLRPSAMRGSSSTSSTGCAQRPLTLEILAAEMVERNELTAILETEREHLGRAGEPAARRPRSSRGGRSCAG